MAQDTEEAGNLGVLVANRSGDTDDVLESLWNEYFLPTGRNGFGLACIGMEFDVTHTDGLDITLGIIAKGRQYGCRGNVEVFGKEVASHPLMVRKRKGRPREDFPRGKAFLKQFGLDALARRGVAEYCRLKTIVGQMQNKILQVESDDCDNEKLELWKVRIVAAIYFSWCNCLNQLNVVLPEPLFDEVRRKVYPLREVFNGGIRPRDMDIDGLLSLDPYMLIDEGKGAAGPSRPANDGVDVIPQDKEMGVVGADMVFVQQVAPVSNESMIFEETPETAQTYQFCNN
ncbi:uncharacterized protein G2W53_026888 [Senna tora]|uniref:Uncharacterized protein n=1 Tax=Senna tora TaxID=362788 RepID=A0A834WHV3_9FABA|nr:uncharacterized protein G2W53_026888 [Senna tora]